MRNKYISLVLALSLLYQQSGLLYAAGEINLANYLSQARSVIVQPDVFQPARLRYISYDSRNNDFKLLLDKGDVSNQKTEKPKNQKTLESLNSPNSLTPKLNDATQELFNYFLIGLSLPNDTFWVNLRPDAPENIIDPLLEKTDIGKIFLEADLQLKKDTASLTSPQNPEGKQYWDKLYKKAGELFPAAGGSAFGGGTENITIPTITRPWIVPNEVIVRETEDSAYIYKATLKVMLEEDYLSFQPSAVSYQQYDFKDQRLKELNEYSSQIIRETIIPKLTREVNSSKRYAKLRQVYYSLVLSRWFKQKYSSLGSIRAPEHPSTTLGVSQSRSPSVNSYLSLIDSGNLANLVSQEPCDKQIYFQAYQKSFKDGEYNLKETVASPFGQGIRSYISGGIGMNGVSSPAVVKVWSDKSAVTPELTNDLIFASSSIEEEGVIDYSDIMTEDQRRKTWKAFGMTGNLEVLLLDIYFAFKHGRVNSFVAGSKMLNRIVDYVTDVPETDGSKEITYRDVLRKPTERLLNMPDYREILNAAKEAAAKNVKPLFDEVLKLFRESGGEVEIIKRELLELKKNRKYALLFNLPEGKTVLLDSIKEMKDVIWNARDLLHMEDQDYDFFSGIVKDIVEKESDGKLWGPGERKKCLIQKVKELELRKEESEARRGLQRNKKAEEAFNSAIRGFNELIEENKMMENALLGVMKQDGKTSGSPIELIQSQKAAILKAANRLKHSLVMNKMEELSGINGKPDELKYPWLREYIKNKDRFAILTGLCAWDSRAISRETVSQLVALWRDYFAAIAGEIGKSPYSYIPAMRKVSRGVRYKDTEINNKFKINSNSGEDVSFLKDMASRVVSSLKSSEDGDISSLELEVLGEVWNNYEDGRDSFKTSASPIAKLRIYDAGGDNIIVARYGKWLTQKMASSSIMLPEAPDRTGKLVFWNGGETEIARKAKETIFKYVQGDKLEDEQLKAAALWLRRYVETGGFWESKINSLERVIEGIEERDEGMLSNLRFAFSENGNFSGCVEVLNKKEDEVNLEVSFVVGINQWIEIALTVAAIQELADNIQSEGDYIVLNNIRSNNPYVVMVLNRPINGSGLSDTLLEFGRGRNWAVLPKRNIAIIINKFYQDVQERIDSSKNILELIRETSSPLGAAADSPLGGIDFTGRAMRLNIERVGSFADLRLVLPEVRDAQVLDLDKEFRQIEAIASSGVVPNSRRILELFSICYSRGEFSQRLSQVISCLKSSSAIQEKLAIDSDDDFRLCLLLPEIFSDGG